MIYEKYGPLCNLSGLPAIDHRIKGTLIDFDLAVDAASEEETAQKSYGSRQNKHNERNQQAVSNINCIRSKALQLQRPVKVDQCVQKDIETRRTCSNE